MKIEGEGVRRVVERGGGDQSGGGWEASGRVRGGWEVENGGVGDVGGALSAGLQGGRKLRGKVG